MEIAIMASLLAKGDMDVNSCHAPKVMHISDNSRLIKPLNRQFHIKGSAVSGKAFKPDAAAMCFYNLL